MSEYGTFSEVRTRLDEIVSEVRKKDVSLEKSLDLYEEAIKLGNRCAELVDKPDFSDEEILAATQGQEPSGEEVAENLDEGTSEEESQDSEQPEAE